MYSRLWLSSVFFFVCLYDTDIVTFLFPCHGLLLAVNPSLFGFSFCFFFILLFPGHVCVW